MITGGFIIAYNSIVTIHVLLVSYREYSTSGSLFVEQSMKIYRTSENLLSSSCIVQSLRRFCKEQKVSSKLLIVNI